MTIYFVAETCQVSNEENPTEDETICLYKLGGFVKEADAQAECDKRNEKLPGEADTLDPRYFVQPVKVA